jgi:hypothetical protein
LAFLSLFYEQLHCHRAAGTNDENPEKHGTLDAFALTLDVSERSPQGVPFVSDFPKIGFNADEVVVTFNQDTTADLFDHILVLSMSAPQLFSGLFSSFLADQSSTPQTNPSGGPTLFPAQMHGSSSGNPMFFVETGPVNGSNVGNSMYVVSATGLLGSTPSFVYNPVSVDSFTALPNTSAIPNAVAAGEIDSRVVSADWRNGHLVAAHTIGLSNDPLTHARWYEFLAPVSGAPSLLQDGIVQVLTSRYTYYPSIAINTAGDLGLNYLEIGGDLTYVTMAVTGRVPSDTRGFMAAGTIVQAGYAKYQGIRGGDYSGIVTDPADGTFWAANEYATNSTNPGNWGTVIDHFTRPVQELYPYASGHDGSGDPEEFVIGLDNQVYNVKFNSSGNPLGGYATSPIASGGVKSISVSSDASGNPLLFAIGFDNQVYSVKFNAAGDPTTGLALTQRGEVQTIALGRYSSNDPELFAIGLDDQVYDQKFDASGSSLGAYALTTAGTVEGIAVGHYGSPAAPEDVVIGLDSQAYYVKFNSSGNAITGYALVAAGQVSALSIGYDGSGNIELFTIYSDVQVYYVHFNSSGVPTTGYALVAPGQVNAIAAGSDGSGDPELFVLGLDDQVYSVKFNSAGTPTTGYALTQGGKVKALTVSSYGSGAPELFVIGSDDQVYDQLFNSSGTSISLYNLIAGGKVKSNGVVPPP